MTEHLTVTDKDAVRVIRLSRPEKKNAITQDMYRDMSAAIDSAQGNPSIRCLVLAGEPGAFTAGNDLEDFLKDGTSDTGAPRASNAIKFLHALAHNAKPIVAAVDGIAIGIGTTMLFHCDQVIASTRATFATPFIHLGLVPEGASSLLAPWLMGHQRAFSMLVMGHKLDAEEARSAGFVNKVVAPEALEAEADKVAHEIAALPAEAVAASRKLLKHAPEDLMQRIDHESRLFGERMRSAEAVAAFKAFFARKKA
ncbi:MAG TPA: crotonase/enoyl-CoA hydratase family protein [Bradyrhizobium sp.]|uniref:crotonase/enoyl-CoA hydratase family protein n=1 Tax=Bradyrhizobium sp. TaxID=376 RepID=UPI002D7FCAA4|nr:crotonase/enoyl-CoA hydratase family protein [Bradyrhizobium sp.]HET7889745.1 crotonase/enoyl-CoA hydratase family protein [Bradyrhizobium sp.]